eukprot:scaffold2809_cov119-Skeletonema_menzelii.AAC.1
MPFGEDNGGDHDSDPDVHSDNFFSDEEDSDSMMQPARAPAATKRKKAQRKVGEEDRKPPAVAVAQGGRTAKVKAPGGKASEKKKSKTSKQIEAARKSIVKNSQNSKLVKKIQVMKEENATPVRMLASMIDDPQIEIVSWVEVEDTSGQTHWCVSCCDADGILTWFEERRQEKYVMKSGQSREAYFRTMFLTEQNFHRVAESEPEEGQRHAVGDEDWSLLMHHPDFTNGSNGKVDWTALANIVGGDEKKNPKRDEIDWKIDDDLKTKRKRKKYIVNYRPSGPQVSEAKQSWPGHG